MPLQNRVSPFGEFEAVAARGAFMGNRGGALHDGMKQLGSRSWTNKRWITCVLSFKNNKRELMKPSHYTELFFLDETTAFAAGHRPCAECRHADYKRFGAAWRISKGLSPSTKLGADTIDAVLHAERLDGKMQGRRRAALATLPDGAMVVLPDQPRQPLLIWRRALHPWSHEGYGAPQAANPTTDVDILTPASICDALRHGYVPVAPSTRT